MSRRNYSQKTFADTLIEGRSRRRKRLDRLDRVDELLDWDRSYAGRDQRREAGRAGLSAAVHGQGALAGAVA